jgi:general stress protein YciG
VKKAKGTSRRGFAAMSPEQHREISRLGGYAVPADRRSFATNKVLAAKAGRKGGMSKKGTENGAARGKDDNATSERLSAPDGEGGG